MGMRMETSGEGKPVPGRTVIRFETPDGYTWNRSKTSWKSLGLGLGVHEDVQYPVRIKPAETGPECSIVFTNPSHHQPQPPLHPNKQTPPPLPPHHLFLPTHPGIMHTSTTTSTKRKHGSSSPPHPAKVSPPPNKKKKPPLTNTPHHSAPNPRPRRSSSAASSRPPLSAHYTSANARPRQTCTCPPTPCFSPARGGARRPPTARRCSWCSARCSRGCWRAARSASGCRSSSTLRRT